MNNNPHNDWESLFEQLPLDTQPQGEHRESLKARVLDTFDEGTKPSTRGESETQASGIKKLGRILMTYKAPYWTAAAILLGCFAWLAQSPNTAFAFEELVNQVVNCRTARYDMEFEFQGKTLASKQLFMAPGKNRTEFHGGTLQIGDSTTGKMMTLDPATKQAQVIALTNRPATATQDANMFESMRDMIQSANANDVEVLGEKTIDGRKLQGFRVKTKWGFKKTTGLTVWADPMTTFPVQIEMDAGIVKGAGPIVMKNYEFNVDLDESLFSMEVPDGYTLQTATANMAAPKEAEFVGAMKKFAETLGRLPKELDPVGLPGDMVEYAKKLDTPPEDLQQVMLDMMLPMSVFPTSLPPEANAQYLPENYVAEDPTQAIFWYKPVGEDQYRIVYADFSVKSAAEPPSEN